MKLILYIKNKVYAEEEFGMPDFTDESFQDRCTLRENYINLRIEKIKNKYYDVIQNSSWKIILVAKSKIGKYELV